MLQFDSDSVTLALADGSQKRYPNEGAFVLIGADPPIAWLEKMGIRFVERPHQHQMGKTDDIVRQFVPRAGDCPEDAARAAAQVLGGSTGKAPSRRAPPQLPMRRSASLPVARARLRSATSIFSIRDKSGVQQVVPVQPRNDGKTGKPKKFEAPVPLSEFAKRGRAPSHHPTHTGHGRRDQLTAGERTRILRMLRDEGGRMADEESQVFVGMPPAPNAYDFDFEDEGAPIAAPLPVRGDVPAKPAVVVGSRKRAVRSVRRAAPPPTKPPPLPPNPSARAKGGTAPPRCARAQLPAV